MASKEVRFDIYCQTCIHYNKSEKEDPCWDCLNFGQNEDSNKPVYWKEKTKEEEKKTSRLKQSS